jgi:hypothetical protein
MYMCGHACCVKPYMHSHISDVYLMKNAPSGKIMLVVWCRSKSYQILVGPSFFRSDYRRNVKTHAFRIFSYFLYIMADQTMHFN